jgi:hypothetical protein
MQKYYSVSLLNDLQYRVRRMIEEATVLKNEDPGCLLEISAPGKWSVAQVLEHLNSYSYYYLPAITHAMKKNKTAKVYFKPGWLGNYFTRLMEAGTDGQVKNKMKAPKAHRPGLQPDWLPVVNTFLAQQQQLLELLEQAKVKDIGSIRIPVSISRFIQLKLGDTFRFLVAHEERHFIQLRKALQAVKAAGGCIAQPERQTKNSVLA